MPGVRIPVGPCTGRTVPLIRGAVFVRCTTDAPLRGSGVGRVDVRTGLQPGVHDETVCTCNPGAHWTRSLCSVIVATVPPGGWLGSSADEGRVKLR